MINLFNHIGSKYGEVAGRLQAVQKQEMASKEKFKVKMKQTFENLN